MTKALSVALFTLAPVAIMFADLIEIAVTLSQRSI